MKKIILFILLTVIIKEIDCQNKLIKSITATENKSKTVFYYFSGVVESSTVLYIDTLLFTKNKLLPHRLVLKNDSSFCFELNIKLDSTNFKDKKTGCLIQTVTPISNDYKCGKWKYYNDKKNIEIIVDDMRVRYKIIQKPDLYLLIKEKELVNPED